MASETGDKIKKPTEVYDDIVACFDGFPTSTTIVTRTFIKPLQYAVTIKLP
jgi:hypothetical protein